MLSLMVMLSLGTAPLMESGRDQLSAPASAVVSRQAGAPGDDAVRRLVAEPAEVGQTYDALVSIHKQERKRIYGTLPASMKSALWNHQFLIALVQHPELTAEQRAVLYDAVELFTPELFEIPFASPGWSRRVDQPVRELTRRAKAAFGVALGGQLFARLGPMTQVVAPQTADASLSAKTLHPAPNDIPPCECSTVSDYCSWEYGSDFACVGGGCYWGLNWGCGTAELYPCNGLCHLQFN